MVSNLGKYLRKLRIDHDMTLRDMADCLGVSAAYVSAIELGKRAAPAPFIEGIANHFKIKGEALEEFKKLADLSQPSIKINLMRVNEQTKEVFLFFARKLEELSPEQVRKLKKNVTGMSIIAGNTDHSLPLPTPGQIKHLPVMLTIWSAFFMRRESTDARHTGVSPNHPGIPGSKNYQASSLHNGSKGP